MHSIPWQTQWKRPALHEIKPDKKYHQFDSFKRKAEKKESDNVCTRSSTELKSCEIEKLFQHLRKKESSVGNVDSSLSSYTLDATISLDSKIKSLEDPLYGDKLSFSIFGPEKIEHGENGDEAQVHSVFSKTLRWPSSAFGSSMDIDEKGIVSVCFCRVSESHISAFQNISGSKLSWKEHGSESGLKLDEKIADAEETLRLLSLIGADESDDSKQVSNNNVSNEKNTIESFFHGFKEKLQFVQKAIMPHGKQHQNYKEMKDSAPSQFDTKNLYKDDEEEPKQLILCCLTNHGHLHFFSTLDLLFCTQSQLNTTNQDEFSRSFESLIFGKEIQKSLETSLLPLANPLISIPLSLCQFYNLQKQQIAARSRSDRPKNIAEIGINIGTYINDFLDLTFFDATMEPSLYRYRTVTNKATQCLSCAEYIAICGRGFRFQFHEKSEELRTRESQDLQEKLRPDVMKDDLHEGGFLSFVSLRHMNETKSLFLPFPPTKLSFFEWKGMSFVACLRDPTIQFDNKDLQKLSKLDETDVILIRIDVSVEGEHSFHPDSRILHDFDDENRNLTIHSDQNFSKTNDTDDQVNFSNHSSRHFSGSKIRRFQPIPLQWEMLDISKLPVWSMGGSREDNFKHVRNWENHIQSHVIDISMHVNSTPPSLVAVHEIKKGLDVKRIATLHHFMEIQRSNYSNLKSNPKYIQEKDSDIVAMTSMKPRHFACLESSRAETERKHYKSQFCLGGQGWSIVGGDAFSNIYFVCWEGATSEKGAHVQPLSNESCEKRISITNASNIILPQHLKIPEKTSLEHLSELRFGHLMQKKTSSILNAGWNFTTYSNTSLGYGVQNAYEFLPGIVEGVIEEIMNKANTSNDEWMDRFNSLEQLCCAWNELEISESDHQLEQGIIAISFHSSCGKDYGVTLRRDASLESIAAPFNKIIVWLYQKKKYIVASAIALKLLKDHEALTELHDLIRKDGQNSLSIHEGLSDGILPISLKHNSSVSPLINTEKERNNDNDLSENSFPQHAFEKSLLADLTVSCMLKGGSQMQHMFKRFLRRNQEYDTNHACLILAAATAFSINNQLSSEEEKNETHVINCLWPLTCLLQVAVARDCMETCLRLLDFTIPSGLRQLPHAEDVLSLIFSSSPTAVSSLLDLKDSSQNRFWDSIEYDAQMVFTLLQVNGKYPLLEQREVQLWVISSIHRFIDTKHIHSVEEDIPSHWLQRLFLACLDNAKCSYEKLITSNNDEGGDIQDYSLYSGQQKVSSDFYEYKQKTDAIRNAIAPYSSSRDIDFGIVIPTLLVLQLRSVLWHKNALVLTQEILNEICDAAGRNKSNQFTLEFQPDLVMKQCALACNVIAAANLIAGVDGLVLKCCHTLMKTLALPVERCEDILMNGYSMVELFEKIESDQDDPLNDDDSKLFILTDEYRLLLRLLEDHILTVQKYGDFDTKHSRGRVNPIFAGRIIFRTWLCIVKVRKEIDPAAHWLTAWLRHRLNLDEVGATKRLAIAALVRILVWPDENEISPQASANENTPELLLGKELRLDAAFLTELAQTCCGMIQCLPSSAVSQILVNSTESEAPSIK